jgi:6-phosphofructokinase 1
MGRHSGFIALHSAIGSGAGGVLIPEEGSTIEDLILQLKKAAKRDKPFGIIIIAEGNKYGGAEAVAKLVQAQVSSYDTKVTIIGHLQRGGSPTCIDRVLASRLGYESVEALLRGESNVMVGIKNNDLSFTSFDDAITKEKKVSQSMMRMAQILAL